VSGLSRLEIPVSGRCNECSIALVIPEEIAIKVSALHHRFEGARRRKQLEFWRPMGTQ